MNLDKKTKLNIIEDILKEANSLKIDLGSQLDLLLSLISARQLDHNTIQLFLGSVNREKEKEALNLQQRQHLKYEAGLFEIENQYRDFQGTDGYELMIQKSAEFASIQPNNSILNHQNQDQLSYRTPQRGQGPIANQEEQNLGLDTQVYRVGPDIQIHTPVINDVRYEADDSYFLYNTTPTNVLTPTRITPTPLSPIHKFSAANFKPQHLPQEQEIIDEQDYLVVDEMNLIDCLRSLVSELEHNDDILSGVTLKDGHKSVFLGEQSALNPEIGDEKSTNYEDKLIRGISNTILNIERRNRRSSKLQRLDLAFGISPEQEYSNNGQVQYKPKESKKHQTDDD